jgi:Phage portal protein, SPP1 Gp6-like
MFDTICELISRDPDYPPRTWVLDMLTRVLNGQLYDVLPYAFHDERSSIGEYIPLRKRRPSVRYPLCRVVVEDSVSLLFSEGHFPTIDCLDRVTQGSIANIVRDSRLNLVMTEAAIRGSVGSVAILMRVLNGRIFFQVMDSIYLTPIWNSKEPDSLLSVTERYKVSGVQLAGNGYEIPDPGVDYWFQRSWDSDSETWYVPTTVSVGPPADLDTVRTVRHGLGFVPLVWIRNLPGYSSTGDSSDGTCTFRSAIETQIEIDYQLSQAGRGLKYSSDPTLLLKEPIGTDTDIIKGAGNALVVSEKGDARLLEIGGTAAAAVIDYVRTLRELALESIHGNRASPERLSVAQSGRALELMNQGLLWLADNLRITYGEVALLSLARMVARASLRYSLRTAGGDLPPMDPATVFSLKWPRWYPTSSADRQLDATTLESLMNSGLISRASAIKAIADNYDIDDADAEMAQTAADQEGKVTN